MPQHKSPALTSVFLFAVICLLGCDAPPQTAQNGSSESTKPSATAEAAPATPVDVQVGGIDDFQALMTANKGKVVLVDYWATWCIPCVEGFPHTVEVAEKYRGQGLETIAVSLDDPEQLERVKSFLRSKNAASLQHLLSKDGGSSASMDAFAIKEGVPLYRIYDRSGAMRYEGYGGIDDMETKIEELLAE